MSSATHPRRDVAVRSLRFKQVKWSITLPDKTVHIVTSFSEIHTWFASHPEVDPLTTTIRRNGSVIQHALRTP